MTEYEVIAMHPNAQTPIVIGHFDIQMANETIERLKLQGFSIQHINIK